MPQVLYKEDVSPGTAIGKTPEMKRVKETQDHISSVKLPPTPASLPQGLIRYISCLPLIIYFEG